MLRLVTIQRYPHKDEEEQTRNLLPLKKVKSRPLTRLLPRLHERMRCALDLLRARAGLVERRADSEAARAGAPIRRDALGRDAADRIELNVLGQNGAPRPDHLGGHRFAGKELQARRAHPQGLERFGHRRDARQHGETNRHGAFDYGRIGVGRDHERAPAAPTASTSRGVSTVPAPTRIRSPQRRLILPMLASGSGELSGTSIAPNPASTMTAATTSTSAGSTPLRIATSGVGASDNLTGAPGRARCEKARGPRRAAA